MEDKLDVIIIKQSQEEIEAYRGGILISALGGIVSVIVDVDILFWYCIAMGLYFFRWSVIINYILILGKDRVIVEKKKNKKVRIIGGICLLLVLLVATSLIFAERGGQSGFGSSVIPSDGESGDMPENWQDFFDQYYTKTTTDVAEINIPRAKLPIDYELKLEEKPED